MNKALETRGDTHNFGRRVLQRAERLHKPRSVFWEWLLLSPRSPLRLALDDAGRRAGLGESAFTFLPSLKFHRRTSHGGDVEAIRLEPLSSGSANVRRELAGIVGRALALFSWLGLSDLHWENLALGVDSRGRVVFGPLDVEMILADFRLPTETKLLPDADPEYAVICQHAAGVRRALPYLGKPVEPGDLLEMAAAYLATLRCLDDHRRVIAKVFSGLPELRRAPIRVCLRSTAEYVQGDPSALWPPLLPQELEQLARGDVPYFFRLYGARGIRYFVSQDLTRSRRLPLVGDVPQLEPLLSVTRGLASAGRRSLREDGLFTLVGAFDHPQLVGRYRSSELSLSFGARGLKVLLPSGEELRAGRDLSAFVSSVYLPCRCGEVRTVLVPPVTRCSARRDGV